MLDTLINCIAWNTAAWKLLGKALDEPAVVRKEFIALLAKQGIASNQAAEDMLHQIVRRLNIGTETSSK